MKDNDPRLFTLDLEGLDQRFEHDYDNVLRSIKGSYRAELKELDQINRPDDKLDYDEAVALLKQARAVKQLLSGEGERAKPIGWPMSARLWRARSSCASGSIAR